MCVKKDLKYLAMFGGQQSKSFMEVCEGIKSL